MTSKKVDSNNDQKKRDPDLVNAEIAMTRAARKARQRAALAGIGVMVYRDGRIVEEQPDLDK
ncbi:MAG: hypothetical protein NTZ57_09690 [Deltaproteobacteria bacterium]|nr:hypothetical protein [Deltaproteobacteria bacterium]